MEEVGPLSLTLDSKQSEIIKQIQLREEAQCQKERGNKFVKVERWDDAIACYDRAIQLVKNDAIYYANRGLCYLKKESLHQAESDCTEALRLDPTYVKALQRRATAREKLGSLRAASIDLLEVLKLEPHNTAAKRQLDSIKQRMGTKGRKAKSSPVTPTQPTNPVSQVANTPQPKPKVVDTPQPKPKVGQRVPPTPQPKAQWTPPTQGRIFGVPQASKIQPDIQPTPITKVEVNTDSGLANWKDGVGENVLVIKPVKKPPHLRSKRALKSIPIKEIPLGNAGEQEKPPMRMKIVEINDSHAQGDTNNNENTDTEKKIEAQINNKEKLNNDDQIQKNVSEFLNIQNDNNIKESDNFKENIKKEPQLIYKKKDLNEGVSLESQMKSMVAPSNSVQFMTVWRNLRGSDVARSEYLSLFEPSRIPRVFANALESDVLSEIIKVLHDQRNKFGGKVTAYLKGLGNTKRLSALVMFLSSNDKELLNQLLVHCKTVESCSDADIAELKKKFEL